MAVDIVDEVGVVVVEDRDERGGSGCRGNRQISDLGSSLMARSERRGRLSEASEATPGASRARYGKVEFDPGRSSGRGASWATILSVGTT